MKLKTRGKHISEINIHTTPNGMWILVSNHEYFLPYEDYPWFKDATLSQIYNVQFLHGHHLHWPDIDVDLDVDSLKHPEKYPLKSKKQAD